MKFNPNPQLGLLILSLISLSLLPLPTDSSDNTTVYEILPKFGLPKGLLPDSVTDYALTDDGSFVVTLPKPCYVQFDYLVYYETQISGQLKYGSIKNLKGIQVQRFFLWFDVDEIKVDLPPSDNIYFQVGLINKKLDVGQFQYVHSCRDSVAVRCGVPVLEIKKLFSSVPVLLPSMFFSICITLVSTAPWVSDFCFTYMQLYYKNPSLPSRSIPRHKHNIGMGMDVEHLILVETLSKQDAYPYLQWSPFNVGIQLLAHRASFSSAKILMHNMLHTFHCIKRISRVSLALKRDYRITRWHTLAKSADQQ
ncbi:Protein of unknown function DUF538 [Dillenia turbinata]|uniref:Uncharacterized protein n=1 Tax=Dillenia turbinata TaxID=194707 RepID=A0AAN8VMY0_9MAGN